MSENETRRARARRTSIAVMMTSVALGFGLVLMPRTVTYQLSLDEMAVTLIGYVAIGSGITSFIYLYLIGEISPKWLDHIFAPSGVEASFAHAADQPGTISLRSTHTEMREGLAQLRAELSELKKGHVKANAGDSSELLEALGPTIVDDVATRVGDKILESLSASVRVRDVRSAFAVGNQRLETEVRDLSKRSAVNLAIGSGITCLAAALILALVWGQEANAGTTWQEMIHFYVPRLGAVIFVEVFGFFFLKQYRATLGEMRTCQREQIELIVRYAALETAWASEESSAKSLIAGKLVDRSSDRVAEVAKETGVDPNKLVDLLIAFGKAAGKKD